MQLYFNRIVVMARYFNRMEGTGRSVQLYFNGMAREEADQCSCTSIGWPGKRQISAAVLQ